MSLEYIASFFYGNGKEAVPFVESWIEQQRILINSSFLPPYETPALCKAILAGTNRIT